LGVHDSKPVVLKIPKVADELKFRKCFFAPLKQKAQSRLTKSEPGAVLLERLEPGRELVELVRAGNDEEADKNSLPM
jgi:streptomycin 6-kinase